jgi:HTH-type transcriptional regulator / antitoxin HigA
MMATASKLDMRPYLKLVRRYPLTSITNVQELDRALTVMDELVDIAIERGRTPEEDAYLNALCDLISVYEQKAYPAEPVEDHGMLEHLLDAHGIRQVELSRRTGIAESTISEVLKGKRRLTRSQISRVAKALNVPQALFSYNE